MSTLHLQKHRCNEAHVNAIPSPLESGKQVQMYYGSGTVAHTTSQ